MKRPLIQLVLFVFVLCTLISVEVDYSIAQNITPSFMGRITYVKLEADGTTTYVQQTSFGTVTVNLPNGACSRLSPTGDFIAVVVPDISSVELFDLRTGNSLEQRPITVSEADCEPNWVTATTFQVTSDSGTEVTVESSITYNQGIEATPTGLSVPQPIILPHHVPMQSIGWSPNRVFALYNQCINGQFSEDQQTCIGNQQVVLYNVTSHQVEVVLEDTNATILGDQTSHLSPFEVFWSPSSRYVLYFRTVSNTSIPVAIYDTEQSLFIDTASLAGLWVTSLTAGFQWSPDESVLGFWSKPDSSNSPTSLLNFSTFSMSTHVLEIESSALEQFGASNWLWSPQSDAIAFVSSNQELRVLLLMSGDSFVLDQNVYLIYQWSG